ncbi:MAG TPA: aldehyde dehydrogenase family protein, partial [Anaeromyxobacter sp.]|nr:aldehyde dehydrogenase family protein [Anaeromyxobacter sp.]
VTSETLNRSRASFYKNPGHSGRVVLVLGAGNLAMIPVMDVITMMFNEGKVCMLKMNPVNAYLGPFIEEAFAPAIERGFLSVAYGGVEEARYLIDHPLIDEIHMTGSDRTHDAIVWGPPGPERAERMARNRPQCQKEITSELGCISPMLVVPGPWDRARLRAQAENVAGSVVNNGSYNCAAGRLLVLPRGWPLRDAFLSELERCLSLSPARAPWYPGALERYRALTEGRAEVRRVGQGQGVVPWTLVEGLDPATTDPAFTTEPFCPVVSLVAVGSDDPQEYLARAVDFVNERVWGTLAAQISVHPSTLADSTLGRAVEEAIRRLRYGTVTVNIFSAFGFAFGTTPWGAYPGSSLTDIQSGRGFVHNTLMVEGVEKVILRYPARAFPKPQHFPSHRTVRPLARRMVDLEAGRLWALPGVVAAGVRG